jgi:hypothetical protein
MKGTRIILILLAFTQLLNGQITYSSTDFINVGEQLVYSQAINTDLSVNYSEKGENIQWDFSKMTSLGFDTISYFDPNDSGYRFYFCLTNAYIFNCQAKFDELTNIAELGIDSFELGGFRAENVTRHFKLTEEEFSETMLGVTANLEGIDVPVAIDFEQKDVVLHFPLTYGAIDSSESVFELDLTTVGFPVGLKRLRKRITSVEGYGQLITPAETYDEVLKVKSMIYNTDTTFLDSLTLPISSVEVEYKWFAKGEKGAVLQASGLIVANNEVISNIRFKGTAQTSAIEQVAQNVGDISIYPNPFNNLLNIRSSDEDITRMLIFDALGRKVLEDHTSGVERAIDVQLLPAGNYFIQVSERNGRVHTRKINKN